MAELRSAVWVLSVFAIVAVGGPLVAQTLAPATVAGTIAEAGPGNEWGASLVGAYIASVFMQQWKRSGIGGLSENQTRMAKRAIAWIVAAISAAGIHVSFDAAAGELVISGLLWRSVLEATGEIVRQYVAQQVVYHGVVQKMES